MAKSNKKVNIQFEANGLDTLEKNLQKVLKRMNGMGQSTKELEKALQSIGSIKSLFSEQIIDGKASISTLEDLIKKYDQLKKVLSSLDEEQQGKISKSTYNNKLKGIRDEIESTTASLKNVETQIAKYEKQIAKLNSIKNKANTLRNSKTLSTEDGQRLADLLEKNPELEMIAKQSSSSDRTAAGKALGVSKKDLDAIKSHMSAVRAEIKAQTIELNNATTAASTYKKTLKSLGLEETDIKSTGFKDAEVISNANIGRENIEVSKQQTATIVEQAKEQGKSKDAIIDTNKALKEQEGSFNKAAKAVFSYTALYRIMRQVVGEAVRTIRDMDEAVTGMVVVTGKSREEVQELIPLFEDLANATSSTMTEIAELTTEFIRQGKTMEDSIILAEQTARAAQIAGISVSESLGYMTSAINGFTLAAEDAERVSDVFANLAATTATDYETLAIALSKVSAQANTAGMSIEYTTALLAKGIETTQEAPESIGTALKTILARMRELTDYGVALEDGASINKVESALAQAGVELRNELGVFREMEDVFNELGPQWESLNSMQQQSIAQAMAGTRQQSRFLAIMQDWPRTMEMIDDANQAAGTSAYQYSQYAEGMEAAMTRLTTAWQGFIQSITNSETIISIADIAGDILSIVNSIFQAIPGMENLATIAVAILGTTKIIDILNKRKVAQAMQQAVVEKTLGVEKTKQVITETQITLQEKLQLALMQAQYTLSGKEGRAKLDILMTEKQMTQQQVAQVTAGRANLKNIGASIGKMAGYAVAAAAVTLAIQAVTKHVNMVDTTLESIRETSNEIYEIQQSSSGIQFLIDEYDTLNNKITKTADEAQRLLDIEKELNDTYETNVSSARGDLARANLDIRNAQDNSLVDSMKIYNRAGDDAFENQEVVDSARNSFGSTIDVNSNSESAASDIINTIDYSGMMRDAADAVANNTAENIIDSVALVGGITAAGAGIGSAIPVVGTAIGAIAGLGIGVKAAFDNVAMNEKREAEATTAILKEQMELLSTDTENFAEGMTAVAEESLGLQLSTYNELLANTKSQYVKDAIKDSNTDFENINALGLTPSDLAAMQTATLDGVEESILSNDQLIGIITKVSNFGTDVANGFIESWKEGLANAKTEEELNEFMGNAFLAISTGQNNDFFNLDESVKARENELRDEIVALQMSMEDLEGLDLENANLELEALEAELNSVESEAEELMNVFLDMISPIEDLLGLTQTFTGLNSSWENFTDLSDALRENSLTLEQVTELATNYVDLMNDADFQNALSNGNMEEAYAMLANSTTIDDLISTYYEQTEAFKERLYYQNLSLEKEKELAELNLANATTDLDKELYQAEIDMLEATIASNEASKVAADLALSQQLLLSNEESRVLAIEQQIKLGEKMLEIQGQEIEGYNKISDAIKEQIADLEKTIDTTNSQYNQNVLDAYAKYMSGDKDFTLGLSDEDNAKLNIYIENMNNLNDELEDLESNLEENAEALLEFKQAQLDSQISLIEQLTEIENSRLEEELESLTENLDERIEAYEEYFDAIREMEEEDDYETDRDSLINRIAQLSTATDATSLQQLKDAQEELADLNDEYNEAQSEAREEAMLDRLERQKEALEEAYDEEMKATALRIEEQLGEDGAIAGKLTEIIANLQDEEVSNIANAQATADLLKSLIEAGVITESQAVTAGDAAKKAIQNTTGMSDEEFKTVYKYKKGGIVDYTGPAWVDGTKSNPEAFLSAIDTRNIAHLTETLRGGETVNNDNGVTIEKIDININGTVTNPTDARKNGNELADSFVSSLKRRGLNVSIKN